MPLVVLRDAAREPLPPWLLLCHASSCEVHLSACHPARWYPSPRWAGLCRLGSAGKVYARAWNAR